MLFNRGGQGNLANLKVSEAKPMPTMQTGPMCVKLYVPICPKDDKVTLYYIISEPVTTMQDGNGCVRLLSVHI